MNCPDCQSEQIGRNGKTTLQDHSPIQKYLSKVCGKQFNERTGTPMARLRTPSMVVSFALNVRTEGLGNRTPRSSGGNNDWLNKRLNGLHQRQQKRM